MLNMWSKVGRRSDVRSFPGPIQVAFRCANHRWQVDAHLHARSAWYINCLQSYPVRAIPPTTAVNSTGPTTIDHVRVYFSEPSAGKDTTGRRRPQGVRQRFPMLIRTFYQRTLFNAIIGLITGEQRRHDAQRAQHHKAYCHSSIKHFLTGKSDELDKELERPGTECRV